MDKIKEIKNKYGDKYKIFVIECKMLNIKKIEDGDMVLKGDGKSYIFLLKPK